MEHKKLSKWFKAVICSAGVCGSFIYFYVIPVLGKDLTEQYPEFSHCFLPWLSFLWITSVPCYYILMNLWNIASEIGENRPFSMKNAFSLKKIVLALIINCSMFFIGNVILTFLNMNHPCILLVSVFICFICILISVVFNVLSQLVKKAAYMREENESYI